MLPIATVQEAFRQAQQASMQLRKLLTGKSRPSQAAVRQVMEAGAQFNWMSQQGKQSSNDTAMSLALARGYHEALDVVLEYAGSPRPPKGSSFFEMALGSVRTPSSAQDFAGSVEALLRHGYDFEDEVSGTALAAAMDRDMVEHARILIQAGALSACNQLKVGEVILSAAMGMKGGTAMVMEGAKPREREVFALLWWKSAKSAHLGEDLDYIASQGLALSKPDAQMQDYIASNRPELMRSLIRNGMPIPTMAPLNEWEPEVCEPFWRRVPHAMFGLLEEGLRVDDFSFDRASTREGMNWLSYMVLHENLTEKKSYSSVDHLKETRRLLPLMQEGGLDVSAVDHRGYTAGWYILLDLIENQKRHSPAHVKEWVELVRDFKLYVAPVLVDGERVPFLEAHEGQMGRFLDQHGLRQQAEADLLNHASTPAVGRPNMRRI